VNGELVFECGCNVACDLLIDESTNDAKVGFQHHDGPNGAVVLE